GPWYAYAIAKQESGVQNNRTYIQFNEIGSLGPAPTDIRACPNLTSGQTNGWGIMQLTVPNASIQQLWNWKANVDGGNALLATCQTEASNWIASQEQQQIAEEPTMGLTNYVFSFSGVNFQKGTAQTPIDACTIQRYHGVYNGWVIQWRNKTT